MNDQRNNLYFSAAVVLILLNIAVFIRANSYPLTWPHNEILYHNLYWASDGVHDFTMIKSGFRASDLIKPFMWLYVEGAYRTRQFSYFIEMLSFKFWSSFGAGYVRNYTLIALHVLNTVLAGFLVWLLTRRKWAAWLTSVFLLNSGAAIATLVFPLRNAKVLVVTLFLLAWIVATRAKERLCDAKPSKVWTFFILLFLACFTDEYAFFLIPVIFVYLYLRDGAGGLFARRFLKPVVTMSVLFIVCAAVSYSISLRIEQTDKMYAFGSLFDTLKAAYAGGHFLVDIPQAFFGYFLRRNFGYWDLTLPGVLAAASFAVLVFQLFRHSSSEHRRLCLVIGAILALKAVVLPHPSGLHSHIMPKSAVFPSLFYFSYYYVYAEAALLTIVIWLLMGPKAINNKKAVLFLCLAFFIGLSNTLHLKNGPKNTMTFHGWDDEFQVSAFETMIGLKKVIRDERYQPVYLSFPSNEESLVCGKDPHQTASFFIKPVLIMYLKDIEEGRAIVSLENIKPDKPFPREEELLKAEYFYDLVNKRMIHLGAIRQDKGKGSLRPVLVRGEDQKARVQIELKQGDRSLLVFVKGSAQIDFSAGQKPVGRMFQVFGYSYQAFLLDMKPVGENRSQQVDITITPKDPGQGISVVGPLVFSQRSTEIFREFQVAGKDKAGQ
ncbi:MAG: DUF2029 domain-containing protein [Candidatus Omnitrophica bacterium]|nr:DUF2029 domain-containing protein [Candidatus Omnitrophota bacterium]